LVALQLSIRLNSIGDVLGTRWVSSSAHAIRAIWKNYRALYKHFHEASVDQNRTSSESAWVSKGNLVTKFCVEFGTHVGCLD
jgi:hypothetical protein